MALSPRDVKTGEIASSGPLSIGSSCGSRGSGSLCGFRWSGRVYDPAAQSPPIATPRRSQCIDGFARPIFCRTPQWWWPLQIADIEGFLLTETMAKLSDVQLRALLLMARNPNGCGEPLFDGPRLSNGNAGGVVDSALRKVLFAGDEDRPKATKGRLLSDHGGGSEGSRRKLSTTEVSAPR